eukprot:gene9474-12763_t
MIALAITVLFLLITFAIDGYYIGVIPVRFDKYSLPRNGLHKLEMSTIKQNERMQPSKFFNHYSYSSPSQIGNDNKRRISSLAQGVSFIALSLVYKSNSAQAAVGVVTEEVFLDAIATLIVAKFVMKPTKQFVEVQSYDKARTNISYILKQLQLQKKVTVLVQNSIDFCDDMDLIDQAQEAGNRVTNTAIQYDSTVYTCVFIPSDDGEIPPNAIKYRKQSVDFYNSFNSDVDTILKVASPSQLDSAQKLADVIIKGLPTTLLG